ncbi:MAG: hypothetical protein KAW89_09850 [Armatimonadetes bacterium]|nr:hypothetical protein [Armatimonadota bacterium]
MLLRPKVFYGGGFPRKAVWCGWLSGTKAVLFDGDGAVLGQADSRIARLQVSDKGFVLDH